MRNAELYESFPAFTVSVYLFHWFLMDTYYNQNASAFSEIPHSAFRIETACLLNAPTQVPDTPSYKITKIFDARRIILAIFFIC